MKEKVTISNIIDYIIGNTRYHIFYSRFNWIIRKFIREQIDYRISVMNRECYYRGSCKECGCKTTALQMVSKPCKGNCYLKLMNKKQWENFKDNEKLGQKNNNF